MATAVPLVISSGEFQRLRSGDKLGGITGGTLTGEAITQDQLGTNYNKLSSSGTPTFSSLTLSNPLTAGNGGTGLTSLGTGVATALGVSVGSAGAFVTNGGALGTPSSGTVTNLTGTASININGTVGATTPNTGTFTDLAINGTLTIGDASAEDRKSTRLNSSH